MMRRTALILSVLASPAAMADLCLNDDGPRGVVESYITAMKAYQFEEAYTFLTGNMHDNQPVADWSETQLGYFVAGEVRLAKPDARQAHGIDGDSSCDTKAIVPHVLRAKDKFNNQGSTEFELYTVIKDGDTWKIDEQESLFDDADVSKWFPDDSVPEYKQQL